MIVLPCGAGKTIVGIVAMSLLQKNTLILTTSITAVKQWRREILDKTTLTDDEVKEYTGETKEIGPVTVATYQILTYRPDKTEDFPHFGLFDQRDWGLIVYDEVHLLPAPVFRVTAQIQARRRLGPDGHAHPRGRPRGRRLLADRPEEVRRALARTGNEGLDRLGELHRDSRRAAGRQDADGVRGRRPPGEVPHRQRERGEGRGGGGTARPLPRPARAHHRPVPDAAPPACASGSRLPIITGSTPSGEREELYDKFRTGEVRHLVLSKVGNFAIDLPDANVLIQVSGTFGSRQEEAQRLGRILRPKSSGDGDAHFYTLVTRDTRELDFAHHRQMFLTEQGYTYEILDEREVLPAKREVG